jgi:hypothetical protein
MSGYRRAVLAGVVEMAAGVRRDPGPQGVIVWPATAGAVGLRGRDTHLRPDMPRPWGGILVRVHPHPRRPVEVHRCRRPPASPPCSPTPRPAPCPARSPDSNYDTASTPASRTASAKGKATGLRNLPCRRFAENAAWLEAVLTATDLICWTQLLGFPRHPTSPPARSRPAATASCTSPPASPAKPGSVSTHPGAGSSKIARAFQRVRDAVTRTAATT